MIPVLLGIHLCRRMADVTLVLSGLVIQTAPIAFFTWFVPNGRPGKCKFYCFIALRCLGFQICCGDIVIEKLIAHTSTQLNWIETGLLPGEVII